MEALVGAGVNFFDHSEAYGGVNKGKPEVMFGEAVRKLGIDRSKLVHRRTPSPVPRGRAAPPCTD